MGDEYPSAIPKVQGEIADTADRKEEVFEPESDCSFQLSNY